MKPAGWIGTLAILLVVALCGIVLAADEHAPSQLELPKIMLTDLVIKPATGHEDVYECTATIIDARTGDPLSTPRLLFPSGEDAKMRSGIALPDGKSARLDIVVNASAQDRTARVSIELVTDGAKTTVQTLRVSL